MKSPLIAITFVACLSSGTALADYPYVKVNYARTFQSATVTDRTDTVEAIADIELSGGNLFGFAIGTDFELKDRPWAQFAWEGEFAYRGANISGVTLAGNVPGGFIDSANLEDVETFSLLGNVWWRPAWFGKIRPYIGGGLGAAYLPSGGLSADNIYAFAYQYGVGVDYEFENGLRAGIAYRHFEISATDRDDDDPLFVFETESELSEDALYASFTAPFSVFTGNGGRRAETTSPERAQAKQAAKAEKAKKRAEKEKLKVEKRASKKAAKEEKRLAKAARKQAKREGKNATLDQPAASSFDAIETASLAPAPKAAPSPKPETVSAAAPTATAQTAQAAKAPITYVAQLGAYSTETMARDMWSVKSQKQPNVFAGSKARIKKVRRSSDSKQLFLLQVGPFDRSRAKAICALAAGECLVARG